MAHKIGDSAERNFMLLGFVMLFFLCGRTYAQQEQSDSTPFDTIQVSHPACSFKTNFLMDAATALNLEFEVALGNHCSLSLPVYYNPFLFSRNYTVKMLAIEPEVRYWFSSSMYGHFLGIHALAGYYNAYMPNGYRYQDRKGKNPCIGGGISYGYSVTLARHWALEFTLGVGYVYLDYDQFLSVDNGQRIDSQCRHYFGPTKAGITLVYKIYGKEANR